MDSMHSTINVSVQVKWNRLTFPCGYILRQIFITRKLIMLVNLIMHLMAELPFVTN